MGILRHTQAHTHAHTHQINSLTGSLFLSADASTLISVTDLLMQVRIKSLTRRGCGHRWRRCGPDSRCTCSPTECDRHLGSIKLFLGSLCCHISGWQSEPESVCCGGVSLLCNPHSSTTARVGWPSPRECLSYGPVSHHPPRDDLWDILAGKLFPFVLFQVWLKKEQWRSFTATKWQMQTDTEWGPQWHSAWILRLSWKNQNKLCCWFKKSVHTFIKQLNEWQHSICFTLMTACISADKQSSLTSFTHTYVYILSLYVCVCFNSEVILILRLHIVYELHPAEYSLFWTIKATVKNNHLLIKNTSIICPFSHDILTAVHLNCVFKLFMLLYNR